MKTITIRLPDVEAAMLIEVQKVNKAYRDLQSLLLNQIQQEYAKTPKETLENSILCATMVP